MTGDTTDLHALVEKAADADLLREMISFAAQRLMELEIEGRTGAQPMARRAPSGWSSATATGTATGRRGPVRLSCGIPRLRKASDFPGFLEPRRMAEKTLTAVIQGA